MKLIDSDRLCPLFEIQVFSAPVLHTQYSSSVARLHIEEQSEPVKADDEDLDFVKLRLFDSISIGGKMYMPEQC